MHLFAFTHILWRTKYVPRITEQLEFGTNIPDNVSLIYSVFVDPNATALTIDMLDNYTVYEVNISALTIIGAGPVATETERTDENGKCLSFPPHKLGTNTPDV